MTFRERMLAETHAPMPRWLYLLDKVAHTLAITVVLVWLGAAPFLAAWIAGGLYVGIGLALWYRRGVRDWIGPGSFTGDALYHALPSLVAVVVFAPLNRYEAVAALSFLALSWWQMDAADYGPVRER